MQEDLLGYLLGALEPDEMRRVEQWLREDAEARRELIELERVLKRLEAADELDGDELNEELAELIDQAPPADLAPPADNASPADLAPPMDLVARTLASLPPLPPREDFVGAATSDAGLGVQGARPTHTVEDNVFGNMSLSSTYEDGAEDGWCLRDWGASIAAVIIVIAIAMPTLLEGRFAARKAACQNNLRELGVAMTQFADRNAQSRLPAVAPDGPQAFAGVYAPRLHEAGLLESPQQTLCPSVGPRGLGAEAWVSESSQHSPHRTLPTQRIFVTMQSIEEIERELDLARNVATGDPDARWRMTQVLFERLRRIQVNAGGDYTYIVGVQDEGRFSSPRYEGRSRFAVMSDVALSRIKVENPMTQHATYRFNVSSHGGRGINVLYEDGHVGFLPSESLDRIPDNPLFNHDGLPEAGVTLDDSSLGPSWQAPFTHASQR